MRALKHRIDASFAASGKRRRDLPSMYAKTAVLVSWAAASWGLLVFWSPSAWTTVPLAVSLGLAMAGIGMGVMHDANHGAYSRRAWVNRVFGFTLDLMGGSAALWRQKHNRIHHTFTNVEGYDDDLDTGPVLRLSPAQPRHAFHRLQHLYAWPLYGLLTVKWVFLNDFRHLARGRYGPIPITRPAGGELAAFVAGKLAWCGWAFVVPAQCHSAAVVAATAFLVLFVQGVVLATTFQLAHCCDAAAFVHVGAEGRTDREWAVLQLETTVDFAPHNRVLTWLLGGLNHQVEHHLFPNICHLHYPALAADVAAVAREHGLSYRCLPTLRAALAAHYRWLRALGRGPDRRSHGEGASAASDASTTRRASRREPADPRPGRRRPADLAD